MRARAPRAADAAPPARRRVRSVRGPLPPRSRWSSSRNDDDAGVAGRDLADLDGKHTFRSAGSLPGRSVCRRNPDKKPARRLRVEKESAQRIVDALEADLHPVVEEGAVPFEAAEADSALRMSTCAREKRHEADRKS